MLVSLTIIRYPKAYIFFALVAMAVHRLPCWLNKNISFYKLMGSGKNGTFDINPDWQQWAIMAVHKAPIATGRTGELPKLLYGTFISKWLRFFNCETYTMLLEPIEGHGYWDGKKVFGNLPKQSGYDGTIAILTRATIRLSKLKAFWQNVEGVATQMAAAPGLKGSFGIGEIPFVKQATFSIWDSKESMKAFAYKMHEHSEVIKKTRKENWYSEDMFVRFKLLTSSGTIHGLDPLEGKL